MKKIYGSITAIVTPMSTGKIDEEGLIDLIKFQIKNGTNGIVPCGTTGESATLSFAEHKRVIELTVETVAGQIPVIAGTGANNTVEAIELTASAKSSGADAVLSVVPYYNKPSQEGLYQHFKTITDAVDIPMILYNVPSRTMTNMSSSTVARLSELPNIIGIKEASGSINQISDIINRCNDDFIVLSGDDSIAVATVLMGGKGVISVTSNIAPADMSQMMEAALVKDVSRATVIHYHLFDLMNTLFCYPSPAPAKKALELMGQINSSEVRLPMTQMDTASIKILEKVMHKASLL